MSVITLDMIQSFASFFGTSLEDGSQYPGVVGSLKEWEQGEGELKAELTDAEATREVFAPLRSAYFKAKGVEEPALSQITDPKPKEGTAT